MPLTKQEQIDLAWESVTVRPIRFGWIEKLLKKHDHTCVYCKTVLDETDIDPFQPTIDHYIPTSGGGEDVLSNCVLACSTCNNAKSSLHPTFEAREIALQQIRLFERILSRLDYTREMNRKLKPRIQNAIQNLLDQARLAEAERQ